jgi:hypothetical protein
LRTHKKNEARRKIKGQIPHTRTAFAKTQTQTHDKKKKKIPDLKKRTVREGKK